MVNDPIGWQPPYSWDRAQANYVPAIYTHTLFANNVPHPQATMDPPLARGYITNALGMPMQHVVPMHAPVHDLAIEMHRSSPFRSDDPPYTAYDPTVPEGEERAPPGTYVHASTANSALLSDLSQIHDLQ
eukprot:9050469-Lingulodinium_polyedra.AAC.1